MQLSDILSMERTVQGALANSKKSILKLISELALTPPISMTDKPETMEDPPSLTGYDVLTRLLERENLGSTALGKGIAIPHTTLPGLEAPRGVLVLCKDGFDFHAPDDLPVDLFFGFLVPENQQQHYLELLASLARLLRSDEVTTRLREATDSEILYQTLLHFDEHFS